jgi:hypothetical protein
MQPADRAAVSPDLSDADRARLVGALTPSELYLSADLATSAARIATLPAVSAEPIPPVRVETAGSLRTVAGWIALVAWAGLIAHCAVGDHVASSEHPTAEDAR